MVVLTDDQALQIQEFKDSIQKQSKFFIKQIDPERPSWLDGRYLENYV